jgi:hypothetical protein
LRDRTTREVIRRQNQALEVKLDDGAVCKPETGVEDIGPKLSCEEPYWPGEHPAGHDEYPFPLHPLDLGDAALREFFGYGLEGFHDPTLLDPGSIPLIGYKRTGH